MTMRMGWAVLAMVGALAAPSWAQDEEPSDSTTGGGEGDGKRVYDFEAEPLLDPSDTKPDPTVVAPRSVAMESNDSARATGRPTLLSVGIGAGFVFPADITLPTAVSVRFRWSDKLTLEPSLTLAGENTSTENMSMTTTTEDQADSLELEVASLVRWRLGTRGKIDLLGLIGPLFRYSKTTTDPNGPNNETKDSSVTVGASWGLGIEYFPRSYWSFSFDAQNPLVSYSSSTRELASGSERTTSSLNYGLVFDPTVRLMAHLYF